MATILKETFNNNVSTGLAKPVLYVDSMKPNSYVFEMYNMTVRYIREKKETDGLSIIKRQDHMAKDENDIYYNKKDGYWIVSDEKKVTLYQKHTRVGNIYNSYDMNKIYVMTCHECPRVVPQVFKKSTLFDDFSNELKDSVRKFRERSD